LSQRRPDLSTGLLKFYTQAEVIKYMKDLAEYYQKEGEKYGDKLGGMLRTGPGEGAPKEEKKKEDKGDKKGEQKGRPGGGGWVKMGTLMLNTANNGPASTEVMYQIHEELKLKLARTNEALKSFEQNASTLIPQNAVFQLYVRNGVPERIIVEAEEAKKAAFNFDGKFRVV
jgi:hypothetical protein